MSFHYQLFYPLFDAYGVPALLVLFVLLLLLEYRWPLRRPVQKPSGRLVVNALVSLPMVLTMRLMLLPLMIMGSTFASQNDLGLLNLAPLPVWLHAVAGFIFLDYLLYIWHVLSHKVKFFWRFHNVHHTDLDLSTTTAIRFHFGEMFLSGIFRAAGVISIGVSPTVVLVYEFAFQAWVAFQHSNWRLPFWLERMLIIFFVTPRMHGIHHSDIQAETNSNFSNLLNVWDRIHGTMRLNVPQETITIGVPAYGDERELTAGELLAMPFTRQRDYWQSPRQAPSKQTRSVRKTVLSP